MIEYADVIVDLQAGDTGKGKVCNTLTQKNGEYTHVVRYNGGGNAGHTIYVNGQKIVTHFIPSGIVNGLISIIGPGCVVKVDSLIKEIVELQLNGIQVWDKLFIDKRVHLITEEHVTEDSKDKTIGTTKTGNGPAYRDKYYRKGLRVGDSDFLKEITIDIYEELYNNNENKILFEGAQGFELDIDWGDYPYVTSSHCTVGSAILNGVPPQKIRNVYGICKAYNTYVGQKEFELKEPVFQIIRTLGHEFGSTTGRPRQIGWTDLNNICKANNINGVTHLIVNKIDILEKSKAFILYHDKKRIEFDGKESFKKYFTEVVKLNCPLIKEIIFSESEITI